MRALRACRRAGGANRGVPAGRWAGKKMAQRKRLLHFHACAGHGVSPIVARLPGRLGNWGNPDRCPGRWRAGFGPVVVLHRGWRLVPAASFHLSFEDFVSRPAEISGGHIPCRGLGNLARLVSCFVALRFREIRAHLALSDVLLACRPCMRERRFDRPAKPSFCYGLSSREECAAPLWRNEN